MLVVVRRNGIDSNVFLYTSGIVICHYSVTLGGNNKHFTSNLL